MINPTEKTSFENSDHLARSEPSFNTTTRFSLHSSPQLKRLKKRWQHLLFSRKLQLAFLEDLNSLIQDGVPANQAISTIHQISTGITQTVAADISLCLAAGQPLAEGMRNWFKPAIVEIIRAGESSGTLKSTLSSAAEALSQETSTIAILLNALIYPSIVLTLALVLAVFIKQSVLESFLRIKPLALWPDSGRHLYHLAEITQHGWWLALCIASLVGIILSQLLRHFTGETRQKIDRIPLLSLYRDTTAARFMQTLGLLISNGIMLKKALNIMQLGAPPYLASHLLMMEYRLSGGVDNIADVLDTKLIQNRDLVRLRVVAKGKGFERALLSLGQQAQKRNTQRIERTCRILSGLLLALAAALAATMVFGIYTVGSSIAH